MRNRFLEVHLNSSSGRIARSFRIPKITFFLIFGMLFSLFIFMLISTIAFFSDSDQSSDKISKIEINDYIISQIEDKDEGNLNFISPISSEHFYISKDFDDSYHQGVDIITKKKSDVKASEDGNVIYSGFDDIYGKIIILAHKNNFFTFYGHLDTVFVKKHDFITKKQLIGLVGETGNSSGPHLHFEIYDLWSLRNPLEIIETLAEKDLTQLKEYEEKNVTK